MQRRTALLTAAAATLTAATVLGNETNPPPPQPPSFSQLWPGPLRDADFGKAVAAELTGDGGLDAVVMDGTTPELIVSPETYDTAISVQTGDVPVVANDFAVLGGVITGKDLLLTVGPAGLERWERASGAWSRVVLRGAGTAWEDALLVRVGNLDESGGLDLVGIGVDSTTGLPTRVLVEEADGAGWVASAFDCVGNAYDLHLLDWDDDADTASDLTDEIAVVTDLGVEVYEPDGTYVAFFSWTGSTIVSAVLDHAAHSAERLALITEGAGANDYVTVFGQGGTEAPVAIGDARAVAATAGDLDGDGDDDLVLGVRSEEEVWVLDNLSPASPGSGSTTFVGAPVTKRKFGVPRNESLNSAGIAVGDFDRDGDLDLLPPAQGSGSGANQVHGEAKVLRGNLVDESLYRPALDGDSFFDATTGLLSFDFAYSASGVPGYPSADFGLEIELWHTPDLGLPTSGAVFAEEIVTDTSFSVSMPETYDPGSGTDVYTLVVRQVVLDGSSVLARGPALTGLVTPGVYWKTVLNTQEVVNKVGNDPTGPDPTITGIGPRTPGFEEEVEPTRGET